MKTTIPAQEIKRRGISVVNEALRAGPVHVISRSGLKYVILSEKEYGRLLGHRQAVSRLWDSLLSVGASGTRQADDIQRRIHDERATWER